MAVTNTYNIALWDDGAGNYNVAVIAAPTTPASGGTNATLPREQDNAPSSFTVTSATAATPIVATIASGHGISAGDFVTVRGGTGDTGINGTFRASAVGATTVTLDNSATAGTYTASSATLTKVPASTSLHATLQKAVRAVLNAKAS